MDRTLPDFALEDAALAQGARIVAGVDEVGRGPLAGPVIAAAVILDPAAVPSGLNDSKVLVAARRAALHAVLTASACWAIGAASVAEIDRINILNASHLAMRRALATLSPAPDAVLIDGNRLPAGLSCRAEAVVRGDARSLSIAAASVIAKVSRDRIMAKLARQHPGYGWEHNAGYPTARHLSALHQLGVSPHHRRSFRPVQQILSEE